MQLRLALAWLDLERGAHRESWRQLAVIASSANTAELAAVACLRGILRCHSHEHRLAVNDLTEAVEFADEPRWTAGATLARGVALMRSHALHAAERDLAAAEHTFRTSKEFAQA